MKPLRRIVGAPFPFHGQREHLAQHLAGAVCPDRGGLVPLQLARAVVGLLLAGAGAALGHEIEELRDVGLGDLRHQLVAPGRFDHLSQHGGLVTGVVLRQFRQMLGDVAVNHVLDARCAAKLFLRRQRIVPLVYGPAQFLGAFARGRHAPLRPTPDVHPSLPPRMTIVDGERPRARGLYPHGKPDHLSVENLIADARFRLRITQGFLIQFQSLDHVPGLLASRHRRRPARLSRQSMGQGAEYRRRPELKCGMEFRIGKSMG